MTRNGEIRREIKDRQCPGPLDVEKVRVRLTPQSEMIEMMMDTAYDTESRICFSSVYVSSKHKKSQDRALENAHEHRTRVSTVIRRTHTDRSSRKHPSGLATEDIRHGSKIDGFPHVSATSTLEHSNEIGLHDFQKKSSQCNLLIEHHRLQRSFPCQKKSEEQFERWVVYRTSTYARVRRMTLDLHGDDSIYMIDTHQISQTHHHGHARWTLTIFS